MKLVLPMMETFAMSGTLVALRVWDARIVNEVEAVAFLLAGS